MTLEEFYKDLSVTSTGSYVNIGQNMLKIIELINHTFQETTLWGLTSHAHLVIQVQDNWKSGWYVTIGNIGTEQYVVEYIMPEDEQPWKYASVRGQANNLSEAKRYLLIAMERSRGWKGNAELQKLLAEYD